MNHSMLYRIMDVWNSRICNRVASVVVVFAKSMPIPTLTTKCFATPRAAEGMPATNFATFWTIRFGDFDLPLRAAAAEHSSCPTTLSLIMQVPSSWVIWTHASDEGSMGSSTQIVRAWVCVTETKRRTRRKVVNEDMVFMVVVSNVNGCV